MRPARVIVVVTICSDGRSSPVASGLARPGWALCDSRGGKRMLDVWTPSGRRKRLLFLAIVTMLLCVCCGVLSHFADRLFNGIDIERLADDLHSSLSVGSAPQAAEEWFARHGIEHVKYSDDADLVGRISNIALLEGGVIVIFLDYGPDGGLRHVSVERRASYP